MPAAKLASRIRRASTLFMSTREGDVQAEKDEKSQLHMATGISPGIQKRPSILRPKGSFQDKMTGSLKLGKQKPSPACSSLALPK